MKRQHPTDPNYKRNDRGKFVETRRHPENHDLYWCPGCSTYLPRNVFVKDKKRTVRSYCKKCSAARLRVYLKDNQGKKYQYDKKWREQHRTFCNIKSKSWADNNPEKRRESLKKSAERNPKTEEQKLRDQIFCWARRNGIDMSIDLLKIKRQQIIMKRTLKQLKEWRKEHESDRDVISGKQRKDEAVNEVNRGREETGHGGDSGLPAGM